MVEQIPYGVATSLINRLASSALREFGLVYGVMDELKRLKNTVESIRAVLLDAEEKQEAQNHAVRIWVRRLNDVLHPADDLLDEFVIEGMKRKMDEAHKNKVSKILRTLSPNQIAFRLKMARKIEKVRTDFNDVAEEMSKLNLSPNSVIVNQNDSSRRETSSFVLESDIVGRECDKKEIINLLKQSSGNHNVSLVVIVGIGGLGKTTLAQLVYNDGNVKKLFEKSMWVCVSENFEVKTIVKNMLESLTKKKIDNTLSLDNLQNMLRYHLSSKRYLLILDDIWNDSYEKWAQLRTYLMCGAQGSRILVTTRSTIVAQTMGVSDPYVLNGLNPNEPWDLLKKIIFGDDTVEVNRTIESIGMKIATKCRGVPLAIRSLGGILQSKSEEREWVDVLQGDFWKLCEDKDNIFPVLKLSYQNLSPQQRQCFAYCALYPKDSIIEKDELIQMWMAQGYLECSVQDQCMEDIGNQFVNIFLMKSFFQEAKMIQDDDIIYLKMHDLMHDLATQVAGVNCCYLDSKAKRSIGRPIHISVELGAFWLLESLDASRLRTLIMFSSYDRKKLDEEELRIISTFKYLRVLKLVHSSVSRLSASIEKLRHLRHLNLLTCYGLESLPKSIDNLVCLQTLKLLLDEKVVLSVNVVSKLKNLRHLVIYDWTFKDKEPTGFGKLSIQQQEGMIFSKWLSSLTNIIEISLDRCQGFRYLPVPPLERLPFLKSLELNCLHKLECIYYEEPMLHGLFFPSLESLHFWQCHKLRGWMKIKMNTRENFNDINSSHRLLFPEFPRLSKLSIDGCHLLTYMPAFPSIKRLSLNDCSVEILEATLNIAASQYSIGSRPLSMLNFLQINETIMDVTKVPQNWLKNLTSLKNLKFDHLSSQHFQAIEMWFKDHQICLPSLQKITFYNCFHLNALPDWTCNLSSLQHIRMINCIDLALLPEGMPHLTNLRTLEIIKCPLLVEECRSKTSALWSKIAHIPNIIMK